MNDKAKVFDPFEEVESIRCEKLNSYCTRLSKRNNSILYLLEKYLNKKLLDESDLVSIRDTILTVSAEISRIPEYITLGIKPGETNERL